VVGLAVMLVWFLRLPKSAPGAPIAGAFSRLGRLVVAVVLVVPAIAGGLMVLLRSPEGAGAFQRLQENLGRAAFSAGGILLLMVLLTAFVWHASERLRAAKAIGACSLSPRSDAERTPP
jgi:hypothetical protein